MKIGDKVRTIGFNEGLVGIVTKIHEGFTPEDHGGIEVRITENLKPDVFSWLNEGDLEHFSYFGWGGNLEVLGDE